MRKELWASIALASSPRREEKPWVNSVFTDMGMGLAVVGDTDDFIQLEILVGGDGNADGGDVSVHRDGVQL